jgi:signal recognition particle subunit SRP72
VAQNNQTAASSEKQNPYLTQRLMESDSKLSGNDQLFQYQAAILKRNQYALCLQMHKFDGVESSASKQILQAPTPTASTEIAGLGVVSAAAHARLQAGKLALKEIIPMLDKRPADIGLLLTIIQLYVQTKNPGPALGLLETFLKLLEQDTTPDHKDVRFCPGLVAVTVALYRLLGRQNLVRAELARAAAHWRTRSNDAATSLLREAGVELLQSANRDDLELAGATFEKLASRAKGDTIAAAGLVASFATTDYTKIESHLQSLTPVERLAAGVDVGALIEAGVASVASVLPASKKRAADTEPQKAGRRRKKRRLPKDYEEGKQPDPERWLPLRDRSTYRPKGKKGKKRAQEATQGGMVKEETLELVGGAGAVKVEKTSTGGGKKKNKKKK